MCILHDDNSGPKKGEKLVKSMEINFTYFTYTLVSRIWVATKQQIYFYWFFSIYCLLPINDEQKTTKSIFFIICQIFAILEDFIKIPHHYMLI